MKQLHFIVAGDENSGKRSFIDKAAVNVFNPYGHLIPGGRTKIHLYKNEEFCIFFDSKNEHEKITKTERVDTFFITLDLSQNTVDEDNEPYWIKRTEFHINRIANCHPKKPIVLLVTKADQVPCDHNLLNQKITNLREQKYNVSYIETSAKDGLNIEKAINLGVDVALTQAKVEQQAAARRQQVAENLLTDLNQYTSFGNKLIAYGKLILSFGQFRLAVKKQDLAEQIKAETSIDVGRYKRLNKELVKHEFNHSCFFAKHYILPNSQENNEPTLDLGELGRILNKAKI